MSTGIFLWCQKGSPEIGNNTRQGPHQRPFLLSVFRIDLKKQVSGQLRLGLIPFTKEQFDPKCIDKNAKGTQPDMAGLRGNMRAATPTGHATQDIRPRLNLVQTLKIILRPKMSNWRSQG